MVDWLAGCVRAHLSIVCFYCAVLVWLWFAMYGLFRVWFVCVCVLFVCLLVCVFACLFACLLVCLFVWLVVAVGPAPSNRVKLRYVCFEL